MSEEARRHFLLRYSVGITVVFVLCEFLQWTPSFLAAALAATFLTALPGRPPLKLALTLTFVMVLAAGFAFLLSVLLRGTPFMLFGLIGLCVYFAFGMMVRDKAKLPMLFLLLCLTTIPVIALTAPAYAGKMPWALIRGTALALVVTIAMHALWPAVAAAAPKPATELAADPDRLALLSTAVLLPMMLAYLMFGWADALPVLITTMMIVTNFDLQRGSQHAMAMVVANFVGGLAGFFMHTLLLTTPTLPFLSLMLLLALAGFGARIVAGGPSAATAIIAANAMLIVFGSAISSGPGSISVWLVRLFQFAVAGAFAVGMMSLLWHRVVPVRSPEIPS